MSHRLQMVALRDTFYAGKTYKKGQQFEIDPKFENILVQTKAAKRSAQNEPKRYQRRDMRAED